MILFLKTSRLALGPPSLLLTGYLGVCHWQLNGPGMKLVANTYVVQRLSINWVIPSLPRFFMLCTGTSVPLYVVSSFRLFDIPRHSWEGNTECLDDLCSKRKICLRIYTDLHFAPLQRKTLKSLFWTTALVDFNVGTSTATTVIQIIFKFSPCVLKHAVGYQSHSVPCMGFWMQKVAKKVVLNI
jgi:hypothetical protein